LACFEEYQRVDPFQPGYFGPEMAKPPGLPGGFGRREIGAGDEIRTHDFNLGNEANDNKT